MKNLLISLTISLVLFMMAGCLSKGYVELTKETFSQLDDSEVKEVDVVSTEGGGKDPAKWRGIYKTVFPIINDSIRINTIFRCIHEANSIDDYTDDMKIPFRKILFKTEKVIYFMGIGWDDKFVYGDWWESADLLLQFKKWGFELPKGKSNLPPSKTWTESFLPPMDAK